MDIDLRKLKHLVTVARIGSLSQAAAQLHITQPALSRSIATLEEQLGIQIFDRSRSGVVPTAVGRVAIAEAEGVLKRSRQLTHNLDLYRHGEIGKVSFGVGPLIASLVLPELSAHFVNRHPQMKVRTSIKTASALQQELFADEVQLFFTGRGQLLLGADLEWEVMGRMPMTSLVRADHPLASQGEVTQADLTQYPLLCAVELSHFAAQHLAGSFICDNYDLLHQTTRRSHGIWISSSLLAERELAEGTLVALNVVDSPTPTHTDVLMIWMKGYQLSPAALRIAEFVRAHFAGSAGPETVV